MVKSVTVELLREFLTGEAFYGVPWWQVVAAFCLFAGLHEWNDRNRLGAYLLLFAGGVVLWIGLGL